MSAEPRRCAFCGTPNDDDAVFCGACGRAIAGPTAAPQPAQGSQPVDVGAKTMLGLPASGLAALGQPRQPGAPSPQEPGDAAAQDAVPADLGGPTMLDTPAMTAEAMEKVRRSMVGEEGPGEEPTAYTGGHTPRGYAPVPKIPGGAPSEPDQIPSPLQAPQPEVKLANPAGPKNAGGMTMLGLPAGPLPTGVPPSGTAPPGGQAPPGAGGMTMLGVPVPPSGGPEIRQKGPSGPSGVSGADAGMTMLGVPAPTSKDQAPEEEGAPPPPSYAEQEEASVAPRQSRTGLVIAIVVILLVLGAGGGLAAVLLMGGGGPTLSPEVAAAGDVLRVTIGVDPAPEGGRVRFAEQEQPITDGSASFEVPATTIDVGDNPLAVEVVSADGSTTSHEIWVHLSHRAVADLSGLSKSPSTYAVRFKVAGGAALAVAGRAVAVGEDGSYLHQVPLSDALAGAVDAGDAVVHRVPFTVRPVGGQPIGGSVDTSIPRARLRVDRPVAGAVTDRETIPVAGVAEAAATVTIGGAAAEATAGRFHGTAPLPAEGDNVIEVISAAPGKAPRSVRVTVHRASSLQPHIERFAATVDEALDYPSLSRDAAAARGRPVRFRGRVVALETSRGQTLMQVLVRDGCPRGEHCFLYVTHDAATSATLQASVTIYGTVAGTRELPTQGGSRLTMPAIDARFVVVARPGGR